MRKDLNLNMLGNQNIKYEFQYNPGLLETFENKHRENDYFVKFNCPEFTSLCPITSQPDFATVYISYVPEVKMIESKSLKLYLLSFRNHGDFHEDCMNIIMKDLTQTRITTYRKHIERTLFPGKRRKKPLGGVSSKSLRSIHISLPSVKLCWSSAGRWG